MALNTSKCNHLTPLPFKGLKQPPQSVMMNSYTCGSTAAFPSAQPFYLVARWCLLPGANVCVAVLPLAGGLDSEVSSVVRQSAKVTGSISGGAKVLGTNGICKYLPVSVSSYVEVCLCWLCSVCIN